MSEIAQEFTPSELSLDDALTIAVRLHRAGFVEDAGTLYERILAIAPEHADALNFLGVVSLHRGQIDKGIELIEKSIAIDPTQGARYNNLGNLLLAAERVDDAVAAYEKAIEVAPDFADPYNNLGIIYKTQGRYDVAESAYKRALEIYPEHIAALNNYGNLFAAQGRAREAMQAYSRALILRPMDPTTRKYIAIAHVALGAMDAAAKIYRDWLEAEPAHEGAKHLLAACSGENVPPRATDGYIESTFDSFSQSFDAQLAILDYRAPKLVAEALGKAVPDAAKRLTILDAGCGTGLCGPLLLPFASHLSGVDLSAGMLEKARARGVYDELVKAELTQFLEAHPNAFDVVLSADTLCYFGVLSSAFNAASRALRPGGLFIFTVERAGEAETPDGHRLNPHGRYSHTVSYITKTLREAGFADVSTEDAVLRQERAEPVAGLVVTAAMNAATKEE